jgi:drug/metabolite transporter (DMT)-like permease
MHGVNPMLAFAVISQQTAVVLIVLMLLFGAHHGGAAMGLGGRQWVLLAASSLIGIGIAHAFYYAAIARLGVAISGGLILLMPFLTTVGSFFLYDERLSVGQWACGTVSVAGAAMMLSTQSKLSHAVHSEHPADEVDDVVVEPQGDLAATGPTS